MPATAPVDIPARRSRRLRRGGQPTPGEPFPLSRRARGQLPFKRDIHRGTLLALVLFATAFGAATRLAANRGLSLDEIVTEQQAHQSLASLIRQLAHSGVHPPLHPALVWLMLRLVGNGDLALRLPSLIAGIALIPAVAWLAAELFDRRTAVVAGAFASVTPILVWYSQEVSGYIFVALFGTLAVIGAIRAAREGRARDWSLHIVAASLAVWSDWSGILIVVSSELVLIAGLINRRRTNAPVAGFVTGWVLDTLALACQLVPLTALFVSQLHANGGLAGVSDVAASGLSFYSGVSNVSWALFGFQPRAITSVLSAVWPLAMLASLVIVGRGVRRRGWLLLACALVPAAGVTVLGIASPGAFDVRYGIAAVAPLLVILARMATAWPRSRTGRVLVAAGMFAVLAGGLVDQQLNRNNPRRYDYAGALAQVRRDAHSGDAVFYEPTDLRSAITRYAPTLKASPLTTRLPTRQRARSVFVVTSFSNQPPLLALRNREMGALRATRHQVSYHSYPGVRVWWFR
jgi:hypothetical protein